MQTPALSRPVSVKLDDGLRVRLKHLADERQRTTHWVMREAIALAERGRWYAAPNPTVGAVLVRDEQIVAVRQITQLCTRRLIVVGMIHL